MIIKNYHIIEIDITQIIDNTLNSNMSFPNLKYIKVDWNWPKWTKWTEVDWNELSGLNWTKLDQIGVCRKPTDSPNPTRPTGLGYKIFFYSGSGWVWVIKLQSRQTRLNPPIFNIYLKYIIYLIYFF